MKKFLTFNTDIQYLSSVVSFAASDFKLTDVKDPEMSLRSTWTIWEQNDNESKKHYTHNMKPVCDFSSVREFWAAWELFPQPSQLLGGKRMIREYDNNQIEYITGIMIFRSNIKPMWEDEHNANGGHFEIRYQLTDVLEEQAQIDEHWNNIVLGMIGSNIEPVDSITGVRLVDRLSIQGRAGGFLRIEIWFSDYDSKDKLLESVKQTIHGKMNDSDSIIPVSITTKSHGRTQKENHHHHNNNNNKFFY